MVCCPAPSCRAREPCLLGRGCIHHLTERDDRSTLVLPCLSFLRVESSVFSRAIEVSDPLLFMLTKKVVRRIGRVPRTLTTLIMTLHVAMTFYKAGPTLTIGSHASLSSLVEGGCESD